jgi:hypothetical protein
VLGPAAKTHSEKQVLVAGTKQSKQANTGRWAGQADRLTGQSGPPNLFQAFLLCFVQANSILVLLKWMFHKLISIEQSIFLRYLWTGQVTLFINLQ